MEIEELLKIGAEIFQKSNLSGSTGSNLDIGDIVSALKGLTGGSGLDIGALLGSFTGSGLDDMAKSWLGDGANAAISPDQVKSALGDANLGTFASALGLNEQEAAGGLSEALPQIIDKGSSGGSLLDSIGGIEGALGLAGKLFGR